MLHDELEKIYTYLKSELVKLRAGRASIDLVENIKIEAYDAQMPLNQLATLSSPEPRLVLIQPWDRSILKSIEKALRENLPDFNPVVDGGIIRIPFPAPTQERRKELVKESSKIVEEAKIRMRRAREDAISEIEEKESRGEISEDDLHRKKDEIQTAIDKYNLLLEEAREKKEKEIMII
jgi:ribosome recycling factor